MTVTMSGKKRKTIKKFEKFLQEGLKIDDPLDIEYVNKDIHRLPQHPIKKNRKTLHTPIIVKLLTMSDKNLIFKAKNLKSYNEQLQQVDKSNPYVFITEHLPEKLKQQRKQSIPKLKEARAKNKKLFGKF